MEIVDSEPGELDELYFESTRTAVDSIKTNIEYQRAVVEELKTLDRVVSGVDCDEGAASLSVTGRPPDTVSVDLAVPDMTDRVQMLIDEYSWDVQNVSYNSETGLLHWDLETSVDAFVERPGE